MIAAACTMRGARRRGPATPAPITPAGFPTRQQIVGGNGDEVKPRRSPTQSQLRPQRPNVDRAGRRIPALGAFDHVGTEDDVSRLLAAAPGGEGVE